MFKNLREYIIGGSDELRKKFPSYFVECLFYNVPDLNFSFTSQDTFIKVVSYLAEEFQRGNARKFVTQSGHQWLFGTDSVQWNYDYAQDFVDRLVRAWEDF